jgi:hypothetical protein
MTPSQGENGHDSLEGSLVGMIVAAPAVAGWSCGHTVLYCNTKNEDH